MTKWRTIAPDDKGGRAFKLNDKDRKRIFSKAKRLPNGCLEWTATRNPLGYANIQIFGTTKSAHRIVKADAEGFMPVPSVKCRHSCHNRACINVDHLSWGTQRDNMIDMVEAGRCPQSNKTHCRKGHELSGQNLRIAIRANTGRAKRVCRICQNQAAISHKARKAGALLRAMENT